MDEAAMDLESQNRDLKEASDWQMIILETIGSNGHDREIIKRLQAGESHQAIADWLVQENPDFQAIGLEPKRYIKLVDVVKIFEAQCQEDGIHRTGSPVVLEISWTKVSSSPRLIGHLFDLYFTWVHPVHMLFSEVDFKHDFKNNQETYCSSSLVNAICAMGCILLDSEDTGDRRNRLDAATLREGFMEEVRQTLSLGSYRRLTAIQTFAIMYLVELSSGQARRATGYLRSALDNLRACDSHQQSEEARELTEWGIQTLNTYEYVLQSSCWLKSRSLTIIGSVRALPTKSFKPPLHPEMRLSGMFEWIKMPQCGVSTDR